MTPEQKDLLKIKLKNRCINKLQERLAVAEQLISRAQDSANNEGKSSAGDKYETGRSMGQLEKQMYQKQAHQLRTELSLVTSTDITRNTRQVMRGSLIFADTLVIFVCAGLGKQVVDNITVLFISDAAPLFKLIRDKTTDEGFTMNNQLFTIREIW
jgi:hypothetical protein